MKKLLFSLAAMIAMVATSCVQADVEDINLGGNEGIVTFVVKTDAIGSRTINDGTKATALSYAIYDSEWNFIKKCDAPVTMENLQATLEMRLVKNKTYNFAFWAQNSGVDCYTLDFENKTLSVNYEGLTANNDDYDAFYGTKTITVDHGTVNESVFLTRPFAQINFAAADTDVAIEAGYNVATAATKFETVAYTQMSLRDGNVIGEAVPVTFTATTNPAEALYLKSDVNKENPLDWLAMNYILWKDEEHSLGACKMTIYNGTEEASENAIVIDYPMAPAKRNWRTNLVGNLLTEAAVIKVEIDPYFEGESTNVGYYVSNGVYHVMSVKGLKDIATMVNSGDESFAGKTIVLENDINLQDSRANVEWTPIGVGGNHFQGTFNGNGHKITGLTITERPSGTSQAALFGTVSGTVNISNLTIEGANINGTAYTDQDFYGSALIGTMYGNVTIKNVNVLSSYISGNNKVGALVAHDGVCSSLKIENCVVDGCTFESTNVADGGLVGGLVGFFQGAAPTATTVAPYGEHHINNSVVKNSTFNVVNSTNTGKRANSQFIGGIYSNKANQKLYIDGCSVENNTWNEKFYVDGVEVNAGVHEASYLANGIVWIGGEREDNANGKVIVNSQEVKLFEPITYIDSDNKQTKLGGIGVLDKTTDAAGNTVYTYGVTTAEGLKNVNKLIDIASASASVYTRSGNDNTYSVEGATFKLLKDVDLTGVTTNGDSFGPIGRYCSGQGVNSPFTGHFDGQGHTIKGIYQSGWDFGYEWGTTGYLGLFGYVVDATIENLTIEGMESVVEGGTLAAVAGRADGKCVFKNITIKNTKLGTYNNRCGAIVGWTGYYKNEAEETVCDFTFENINICEDVVLGGLWGSFDSSIGGVMGQLNSGVTHCLLKNVTISCRIDAYNDCTASYDYYLYRMCGMIIGQMSKTTEIEGSTYPDVARYGIEFDNVVVNYGKWMNYHYCEPTPGLNGGRGMRVEAGFAYDGLPADFDHTQCVDNHYNCIPFDQLFGGVQTACKGVKAWEGVTVNYPAEYTCTLCGQQHNVK